MDVQYVAQKIEQKIQLCERGRTELNDLIRDQAMARAEYDRAIAVTLVKLRNGVPFELEGHTIKDPPVSILDKTARGICHAEKLAMESAEGLCKACTEKLRAVQAELNGYQSIYKHLSVT